MKNSHLKTEKSEPTAPRIAIIDPHPMFRRGIISVLSESWKNASFVEADQTDQLFAPARETTPDFVFIGLDGNSDKKAFQQIPLVINRIEGIKVILYDYRNDLKMIPRLLKLGIHGYLSASFDATELKQSITTISQGKRYINNDIVWEYLNHETPASSPATIKLSKMEEVVADYLIKGVSVSQIARSMNRQLSTISTVKAKVFKKLMVDNVLELKEKLSALSKESTTATPP